MMKKKTLVLTCLLPLALIFGGCHKAADDDTETATATPKSTASPLVGFEKDLQFIKNGQYSYIYVFSRKDGKPLQPDDSQFLRKEAPQMVDCVTSEEGKKAICGTNFNLEEGNMGTLKKRLNVEDYSAK
ncbi:MAG TPA: hypothetical protein VI306_20105 [Pyrinomonadaceae bacterium]